MNHRLSIALAALVLSAAAPTPATAATVEIHVEIAGGGAVDVRHIKKTSEGDQVTTGRCQALRSTPTGTLGADCTTLLGAFTDTREEWLTAAAPDGWVFERWSGAPCDAEPTDPQCRVFAQACCPLLQFHPQTRVRAHFRDVRAPDTAIASGPVSPHVDSAGRAVFDFTVAPTGEALEGPRFHCQLNGDAWHACTRRRPTTSWPSAGTSSAYAPSTRRATKTLPRPAERGSSDAPTPRSMSTATRTAFLARPTATTTGPTSPRRPRHPRQRHRRRLRLDTVGPRRRWVRLAGRLRRRSDAGASHRPRRSAQPDRRELRWRRCRLPPHVVRYRAPRGEPRARHTIRKLTVSRPPTGARVELTCRGRTCPKHRWVKSVRPGASRVSFTKAFRRARLTPNTVIRLEITKPNMYGKLLRLTTRKRHAPAVTRRCVDPVTHRRFRC